MGQKKRRLEEGMCEQLAKAVNDYNEGLNKMQVIASQYQQIVKVSREFVKAIEKNNSAISNRVVRYGKHVQLFESMNIAASDWLYERGPFTKLVTSLGLAVKQVKSFKPIKL